MFFPDGMSAGAYLFMCRIDVHQPKDRNVATSMLFDPSTVAASCKAFDRKPAEYLETPCLWAKDGGNQGVINK